MKKQLSHFLLAFLLIAWSSNGFAQTTKKSSVGVLDIDVNGIMYDSKTIGSIVRLEVDKTGAFVLIDKYEMADIYKKENFSSANCYSKSCLVTAGKLINADKMISGSVERFGEKIIVTMRLINVQSGEVEKSEATEFLNLQTEIQKMIEVSVKKLLGLTPDPQIVNQLMNYDLPIESPRTTLKLNGPRMGGALTTGETGKRLQDPKDIGGFDMYPATFQFGYQHEVRYLSAGEFQALIEFVGLIGGLESGHFIPSISFLNGFRWGRAGWEIGFGPNMRFVKKADGFYDTDALIGTANQWHIESDWFDLSQRDSLGRLVANPYNIVSRIDNRGSVKVSTGLVIAAGRTFRSGYLNIPVNLFVSPRKDGWLIGFSFGFNVSKKPKVE